MTLLSDHFRGLLTFTGRERRQPFWLWVLVVMAAMMIGWMAIFLPVFFGVFGKIEQFARDHPDQVTRTVGPGSYSIQVQGSHPELMPDFSLLIGGLAVLVVVVVILLAAAVVRRLQDSDRSGWWGIAPLPFLFMGLFVMNRLFSAFPTANNGAADGQGPPDGFFFYFGLMMINNLAYLAALVMLIVLCCLPGKPGENRYGAPGK